MLSPAISGRNRWKDGSMLLHAVPNSIDELSFFAAGGFLPTVLESSIRHYDLPTAMSTNVMAMVPEEVGRQQESISYTAVAGSSLIMVTIVSLLYLWEVSVEWVRESVPKTLLPVVESILAEIGGLGFIGLILSTVLGNHAVKEFLEASSVHFFGEGDILVENFEYLHAAFFQVGVGFFLAAGVMVAVGLQKLKEIETVEGLQVDPTTGSCTVTADKISAYLPATCWQQPILTHPNDIDLWQEIFMSKEERAAKTLLLRDEFLKRNPHLTDAFRIESVVQASFAYNLLKIVKISPLTWIYLIPALALANAIDLSHEVVNASSPNAAESVGYFFSTLESIGPATFTVVLSAVWGLWNCWKLTQIKYMVLPRLRKDCNTGKVEILPPLADNQQVRDTFNSSPGIGSILEGLWATPAESTLHELFGTAGAAGIKLYRNSIKYQTWLCLTHVVFFGTQIVPRDVNALFSASTATAVGDSSHLMAELVTYGGYVLLSLLQLALVTPRSLWNFCLVSCLDEETAPILLKLSRNEPGIPMSGYDSNSSALEIS
eukprot:CAMPEP_0178748926 /NCGR_PEP_ID=MMETSP0744-20121128/9137_1 /TAXON_ID=913974 /ORGANISM="Nitzschia punctata, Strain CCMP561" /LENGTH=545 /DNA_ID=CAMNT_0020402305 /DNA_START=45 /DNA_END=1682 /DNA_ORIENTATION=-